MENAQFHTNVYHYTEEVMKQLLEEFKGKEVGSEEMDLSSVMNHFFGDFKPGDKVKFVHDKVSDKKVKKKKDPNAPKRPTTAFFYYKASIQEEVKADNPGKPVSELSKVHGEMWRKLSDKEKKPFNDLNEKDKERYSKEKAEYEASK